MEYNKVKVWLTCPKFDAKKIRLAIGDAGIGKIGNYSHCSFVTEGKGYYKPNKEANPHTGEAGKLEEVDEVIIEFVCEKDQIKLLRKIVRENHPYEEVAMDIFPLLDSEQFC